MSYGGSGHLAAGFGFTRGFRVVAGFVKTLSAGDQKGDGGK